MDVDPWLPEAMQSTPLTSTAPGTSQTDGLGSGTSGGLKEHVSEMSTLVDQTDESELGPPTKEQVDKWLGAIHRYYGR